MGHFPSEPALEAAGTAAFATMKGLASNPPGDSSHHMVSLEEEVVASTYNRHEVQPQTSGN